MAQPRLFISYARHDEFDRDSSRRLYKLLRRPLEGLAQIFLDEEEIEPNSLIDRDIGAALDASAVAVLLVSPDFVNSDYVNDHELPAIYDRYHQGRCRVWPLNARASVVRRHRYLEGRLLVPELDRPLRSLPIDQQESILAEVGDEIVAHLEQVGPSFGMGTDPSPPEPDWAPSTVPSPAVAPPPVAALDLAGPSPGRLGAALNGVPVLPDDHVARAEAIDQIWSDLQSNATAGIGGERSVGLHGQGGVGKSVLAAAVCRDPRVRAAFPGGVLWLTVGERANPLVVQSTLVSMLGHRPDFSTTLDGRAALERILDEGDESRLIVLDDVWSPDVLDAIPPPSHGRRLITTRDVDGVLGPAGVVARTVDLLDPGEARTLAARRLGVAETALPEGTDELLSATGGNALLVATMASALAMGGDAGRLLARIQIDGENPHPYLTVFRVLRAALGELDDGLARRYLRLAVFPPDVDLPVSTVATWWHHLDDLGADEVARDLGLLHERNLLTLDRAAQVVRLHDHQHDFVSYELADPPRLLHGEFLAAVNPGGVRWGDLDPDDYVDGHLVHHVSGAGRSVADAALDARFLARRIRARGPYAAIRVLEQASGAAAARAATALRRVSHLVGSLPDVDAMEQTVASWTGLDSRLEALRPLPGWPLDTGSLQVLPHPGPVNDVAYSPDGSRLATASTDRTVRVWDPVTGAAHIVLALGDRVSALAWRSPGLAVAYGHRLGVFELSAPDRS